RSVDVDREILGYFSRVSQRELLRIRHREVFIQNDYVRRCVRTERGLALTAVWIRIGRIRDRDAALGNISIFREVQQRLNIVEIKPRAAANDILIGAFDIPCEPEARTEILRFAALAWISKERNRQWRAGCRILEGVRIETFVVRSDFFVPPQADIQREVRT